MNKFSKRRKIKITDEKKESYNFKEAALTKMAKRQLLVTLLSILGVKMTEKYFKNINGKRIKLNESEIQEFLKRQKNNRLVEELKQEKILELKKNANNYILIRYPYYRQLNIVRNGTVEELAKMSSFIDGVRNKVNQLELDINSSNTEEELTTINYNIYDNNK